MRHQQRQQQQQQQATTAQTTALTVVLAYRDALQENRQHCTPEQVACWDNFWDEQTQICHVIEAGEDCPLRSLWVWRVKSADAPQELEYRPSAELQ